MPVSVRMGALASVKCKKCKVAQVQQLYERLGFVVSCPSTLLQQAASEVRTLAVWVIETTNLSIATDIFLRDTVHGRDPVQQHIDAPALIPGVTGLKQLFHRHRGAGQGWSLEQWAKESHPLLSLSLYNQWIHMHGLRAEVTSKLLLLLREVAEPQEQLLPVDLQRPVRTGPARRELNLTGPESGNKESLTGVRCKEI
ncbi:hypothetical protein INR49_010006 [Caranx melampygus]|nr:hypothetical protein INR49_010006 [Caranx melampygus]